MRKLLGIILTCLCFFPLAHSGPLKEFEAVYKAKFRGIGVTAVRKLETLPDGRQQLTFSADSWIADLSERSIFTWTDAQRLVPHHYTYKRGGLGRNRVAELTFNWETHKVINDVEGVPWKMTIPDLALDKLSYQVQLQADLVAEKTPPTYQIADGGSIKEYSFEVLGEETLQTPAGKFRTVKVKRVRGTEEKRQTIFWLAPDWEYLVVRLQQDEGDSKSYEIDLHSAVIAGQKVKGS